MESILPAYTGPERRSRAPLKTYEGAERRRPVDAQTSNARQARGMESRAKFLGHAVHQQLVVFPVGLLATAVVFDLIYLLGGGPTMAVVSFWMIVAGLVGGALAAPFGFIDWLALPEKTRAKAIGTLHGIGNLAVVFLFLISALYRINDAASPPALAFVLSFAGGAIALVTAWLGGELVSRLGVGVSAGAGLDAPSSLRERHASGSLHEPR